MNKRKTHNKRRAYTKNGTIRNKTEKKNSETVHVDSATPQI